MVMIVAAILVAGAAASLTDWLLMGVLFHDAYNTYPEVWWPSIRDGETKSAVTWSVALGFVMTAAVVLLCARAGVHSLLAGIEIAAIAFAGGPLVLILVNAQFVKTDVWTMVSHGLGYFARMALAGFAAGLLL